MKNLRTPLIYQALFLGFGALLTWPIYQVPYFFVTVISAAAIGFSLGYLRKVRGVGIQNILLMALGAFALLAPPLTNPSMFSSLTSFAKGWLEVIVAVVDGWKKLVTIDAPVGTYHGLLLPAFLVFAISAFVGAIFTFGEPKRYWINIIPFYAIVVFAIAFGEDQVATDSSLFGMKMPISGSLIVGLAILTISISYLSWGASSQRRKTTLASGVAGRLKLARRFLTATALLIAAALVGGFALAGQGIASQRTVFRTVVQPLQISQDQVSPISAYRKSFANEKALNTVILNYETNVDRIRVATMSYYDGRLFAVSDPAGSNLSFKLMPNELTSATGSDKTEVSKFTVPNLGGIWIPLVNNLKNISFNGQNGSTIRDGFYFSKETFTGALADPTLGKDGLEYTVDSYVNENGVDPTLITPGPSLCDIRQGDTSKSLDASIPDSLCQWISLQMKDLPVSDAASFNELAKRLRARGYLSHSLAEPTGKENWLTQLGKPGFESSSAGHSKGRIAQLFDKLNALQERSAAKVDSKLVAAVGDDEQFATAIALLARAVGFESRVVVGFRTQETSEGYAIAPCENGECRGKNLTAWVEIARSAGLQWFAVDATPQYKNKLQSPPDKPKDPENATNVSSDSAKVLPPDQAKPPQDVEAPKCEDGTNPPCSTPPPSLLPLIGFILMVIASLGVVSGPFLLIIFTKRSRRKALREEDRRSFQITGAWDEYRWNMIDLGKPFAGARTRPELVALYGSGPEVVALSDISDEAAFAPREPKADAVERAWAAVATLKQEQYSQLSLFKRFRAEVSLRSLLEDQQSKLLKPTDSNAFSFSTSNVEFLGSPTKVVARLAGSKALDGYRWLRKYALTIWRKYVPAKGDHGAGKHAK